MWGFSFEHCYHDMSDSDVGSSDTDESSGHASDDDIDNSDGPVEIKDGQTTFFIKDSSGNLITCSQDLLCKCVSVYEFVLHSGYSAPIRDSWVIMVTSKLYNLVVYTMTYIP